MCRTQLSAGDKDTKAVSCIVPTKALSMIQRLITSPEEQVQIAITDNQIFFTVLAAGEKDGATGGRATLSSNLVEGSFPPYEDVIPKDHDKKVIFDKDVLASAVRRAALLTNEESRGVRLHFTGRTSSRSCRAVCWRWRRRSRSTCRSTRGMTWRLGSTRRSSRIG